jgi:hypothetical protein
MLVIPEKGMLPSVSKHNCRLDTFADWIEASLLFGKRNRISQPDVVDILREEEIYEEQGLAWQMADMAWIELKRRAGCHGAGSPYKVEGKRVVRVASWRNSAAHSFFLTLSLAKWYPKWAERFGSNYGEQGHLFERVTLSALEKIMPKWSMVQTGWSRTTPSKIKAIVPVIARALGDPEGDITPWVNAQANEAGLDILCVRSYSDRRAGVPAFMVQCASGLDYYEKAKTPDLDEWGKLIEFTSTPKRALTSPFAFDEQEFKRVCNKVDGPLFDRCRLLFAGADGRPWIDKLLAREVTAWTKKRISKLRYLS